MNSASMKLVQLEEEMLFPSRTTMLLTMILLALPALAGAAAPPTLAHEGVLTDANGAPVTTSVVLDFALYGVATGGTALWSESDRKSVV